MIHFKKVRYKMNEQDVHLLERLAFMNRRDSRG